MTRVGATSAANQRAVGDLFADIRTSLEGVEHRLQEELRSRHDNVDQVVRHGYRLGGKRLRPALLLLSGQAAGKLTSYHETLAVVVEMIHTATLVHDDILDEADLRRHVDTVNARWGNETSVLLGDFLFSHAFYLASTVGTAEACQLIGKSTNRVCEGEMRQTLAEGDLTLSEDDYYSIIDAKTAELCACCCELGARFSDADEQTIAALSSYGRHLGMAFQIADDLLDLAGDEQATGKSLGRDLAKRKLTLPLIHARDTLVDGPRTNFLSLLEAGAQSTTPMSTLKQLGSLEYARDVALQFADKATADLSGLADSPAKATLEHLAAFVVSRQG
ncbi:polyprenyl synthetase family protein [Aeoliella sp. ICT_H6.2]|uniref:Polyprenyl synthetase family protein n=1 Tax=Aeoliella straminimaris TaxID=2954799 RepID=A0A9X2FGG8_9BACT|nr:polyprenyl synthetase family protein [Aeoliella straminimaris]MCO6043831.1 polyprenyl synthetase family protein [Aeoliella straminimaris]